MFDLISNFVKAKSAEYRFRAQEIATATAALEEASGFVTERPGGRGWELVGATDKGHTEGDQLSMIAQARKFFRFDSLGRPAIWNAIKYIFGRGITITPQSSDPKVWFIWRDFWESDRNRMGTRQFEIGLRSLRDGNCLMQYFRKDEAGNLSWKTTVRFRDPLTLQKPTIEYVGTLANGTHGIVVDPDDIETPVTYWFQKPSDRTKYDVVDASDIQHTKIFADSDQKVGESFIQPVMRMFTHYQQWLENRILLNKIRTAIALIKKVKGTSSDVSRISTTLPTSQTNASNETKTRNIRGGTIYTANAGVEYEMLSPNLQASDAKEDGRNIIVRIAGGTGMPEFLFGDASNANFASTLIAESPFVKEIQFWQAFFEAEFKRMFRRVIKNAVEAGALEEPKEPMLEDLDGKVTEAKGGDNKAPARPNHEKSEYEKFYGCDIQWPEIIHRDFKTTTEAVILQRDAGLISDPTACATLGYDYDEEVRKQNLVLESAQSSPNPFVKGDRSMMDAEDEAGDRQEDDELEDIFKSLNDEERRLLIKMENGQEVMDFLNKRATKKKAPPPPVPAAA